MLFSSRITFISIFMEEWVYKEMDKDNLHKEKLFPLSKNT